ncbi:MAG TPA: hypothetical protein VLF90_01670 [Patescibacteria group bacterium]|nr:hypothetical protein [Patescibacteria group bacterium]
MLKTTSTKLQVFAWALTGLVILLAVLAWGQGVNWQIVPISTLHLFPIFGLIAFSTMWAQYMVSAGRQLLKVNSSALKLYYNVTGYLVLACILLHPGLLTWQLWRNGGGLPPGSELSYVMPGLKAFVILGIINLTILLLFELRRAFAKRPWWKYMSYLVDATMLSIFIHSLRLGTQLQHGWFRGVWLFYGASLVLCLAYIYNQKLSSKPQPNKTKHK